MHFFRTSDDSCITTLQKSSGILWLTPNRLQSPWLKRSLVIISDSQWYYVVCSRRLTGDRRHGPITIKTPWVWAAVRLCVFLAAPQPRYSLRSLNIHPRANNLDHGPLSPSHHIDRVGRVCCDLRLRIYPRQEGFGGQTGSPEYRLHQRCKHLLVSRPGLHPMCFTTVV